MAPTTPPRGPTRSIADDFRQVERIRHDRDQRGYTWNLGVARSYAQGNPTPDGAYRAVAKVRVDDERLVEYQPDAEVPTPRVLFPVKRSQA